MYRTAFIIFLVIISAHKVLGISGSGTEAEPWRIQSLEDFNEFAADANYWSGYTRLETDVNLAGLTYTTAVIAQDIDNTNIVFDGTAFIGVFDGNDHKIINLTIDGGDNNDFLGLFGCIEGFGEVKNLGLEGVYIVGTGWYVGGLVGENGGNVSHCYSNAVVSGYNYVGGLVGRNYTAGISNCHSTGDVSGTMEVGGLVGKNGGSVSNSYSTGDVGGDYRVGGLLGIHYDGTVLNCYSTGDVSGDIDVGGLLGWNFYGIVSNCFWDTETQTHGVTESIGLNEGTVTNVAGLPTAQMQTKSTFTDAG
jgi:hypothetical protein